MMHELDSSLAELFRDQYLGIHSLDMHQDVQPLCVLGNMQPVQVFQGESTYTLTIRLRFDRNTTMGTPKEIHRQLSFDHTYSVSINCQYSNTNPSEAIVLVTYQYIDLQEFIQHIKEAAWKAFNKGIDKALSSILTEET